MAWRRSGDKPLFEPMMVCYAEAYMYMRLPASMSFNEVRHATSYQISDKF